MLEHGLSISKTQPFWRSRGLKFKIFRDFGGFVGFTVHFSLGRQHLEVHTFATAQVNPMAGWGEKGRVIGKKKAEDEYRKKKLIIIMEST